MGRLTDIEKEESDFFEEDIKYLDDLTTFEAWTA